MSSTAASSLGMQLMALNLGSLLYSYLICQNSEVFRKAPVSLIFHENGLDLAFSFFVSLWLLILYVAQPAVLTSCKLIILLLLPPRATEYPYMLDAPTFIAGRFGLMYAAPALSSPLFGSLALLLTIAFWSGGWSC